MSTVQLGDSQVTIEKFSVRKGLRVLHAVKHISKAVPELLNEMGTFVRDYETDHVTVIDRATARYQLSPAPLMEEEPLLVDGQPATDNSGSALWRRTPKLDSEGKPVMGPDPLGHITEDDWAASNHTLKMPRTPTQAEIVAAIFPIALERAENELLELLAIISMTNAELRSAERAGFQEALKEKLEWLYDLPFDDLIELAVAGGEMVDQQYKARVEKLGARLPNLLRLFGLNLESQSKTSKSSSSTTTQPSLTDSPQPTDGARSESSTTLAGSPSSG